MEVCPKTGGECIFLTATREFKYPLVRAISQNRRGVNERLASEIFDETHRSVVGVAQETYCSSEACGVEVLAVAQAINLLSVEMVQEEFNSE